MRSNVEQKVIASKYHIGEQAAKEEHLGTIIEKGETEGIDRSNINMIKRF